MELYPDNDLYVKIERMSLEVVRLAAKNAKPAGSPSKRANREFQMKRLQAKLNLLHNHVQWTM